MVRISTVTMCRLFVFVVCILLAYSIVEANRVKPVEKNERIAAKQHAVPAARNSKLDKTPDMIKKHDAKNENRATRKHQEKTEKVIPKEEKKEKITRKHLEKTEKVIPKEVKKDRIFHKEKKNKQKRELSTVDIFAQVNKHAKKEYNYSTVGPIPTLGELMSMWDADTLAFVNYLVNISGIELCVHHYAEFDDYEIGFVCEPGYCVSSEILCDYNTDCNYFNDETPLLCDIPDYYYYPEYEWECAWFCITGYDPYTGEEMWGEITCHDECDGYMDCYYGEDEYCGGWYETFGCPIHVYDYWGKEYWMYTTIDGGSVCDGFPDCADGSDEEECYTDWYPDMSYDWYDSYSTECGYDCWSGMFVYGVYIDNVNYIPCSWECDGYPDCDSGYDESYCIADSYWNWYSDSYGDECGYNCDFGYQEYGVYVDYTNYIPCTWECDGWDDCGNGMDEMYCTIGMKSVDNKKSEEKKRAKISKGRQERASVRSNPNKKQSKKAKHGKQGKRHVPSVKKTKNTVRQK